MQMVPLLHYHLFFIMNCVFAKMFCTLICSLNQVFFFLFFREKLFFGGGENNLSGVTFGCCHSIADVSLCVILVTDDVFSYWWRWRHRPQLRVCFWFGVDGSNRFCFLMGLKKKKNCNKRKKCKLHIRSELDPLLWRQSFDSLKDEFYMNEGVRSSGLRSSGRSQSDPQPPAFNLLFICLEKNCVSEHLRISCLNVLCV